MARTFCPEMVHFDGTTDLLNASPTATASGLVTVSQLVRFNSADNPADSTLWEVNPSSYSAKFIRLDQYGRFQMSFGNYTGTPGGIDVIQDSVTDYGDGQPHHVLVSVDMTSATVGGKRGAMYIDGVNVTGSNNSFGAAAGSFVMNALPFYIGTDTFGDPYTGDMGELWIMPGLSLLEVDNTIGPTNLAKFFAGGCPADLGSDGSAPTGTAPPIYLSRRPSEPASAFLTNRGTGGNFTIDAGALTTASGMCACTTDYRPFEVQAALIPARVGSIAP